MTVRKKFTQIIQLFLVVETDGLKGEGLKTAQLRLATCPCRKMGDGHD